jgi:hypothetical protein
MFGGETIANKYSLAMRAGFLIILARILYNCAVFNA